MAKPAKKNVVFVSHSSRDRQIVNAFVEGFLPDDALTPDTKKIYTSADDPSSTARLKAGESVWTQIHTSLTETACFIACLSDNYFKSNWCIAELAVFHEMRGKKKDLLLIPLLIDPDSNTWGANPFTQSDKILRLSAEDDLTELVYSIQTHNLLEAHSSLPKGITYREFISQKLNPFLNSVDQKEKGFLAELATSHFSHPHTTNGPMTCFVQRAEYEQISINMAERAKAKLLWTLFKSPLLVADAYNNPNKLMDYDERFAEFTARKKVRLVIFDEPEAAQAYAETNVGYHEDRFRNAHISAPKLSCYLLSERKLKFEDSVTSNGGLLYFTELSRLATCFPTHPLSPFNKKSYLEFAYCEYSTGGPKLLLESGFTSEFSYAHAQGIHRKSPLLVRHVTFYSDPGSVGLAAIQEPPYNQLVGHLDNLRLMAEAIFSRKNPDPRIFVTLDMISKLYENTP